MTKLRNLLALREAGFRVPEIYHEKPYRFPVVVRSSASLEDGSEASFAGQFESFLNLKSYEEVDHAIEKVKAMRPVGEYLRRHGIDDEIEMDVIVQRMVQPELAGVAFTVNPVTGADEIVIEAVHGLADQLLQGRVKPLPESEIAHYRPMIERECRRIQRHFGCPQDIEFAIENGEIYIVQARPITRIQMPDVGEWTNADFRDGGVSSAVCTPLMWSLYDYIWEDALKGFLKDIRLFQEDFQAGRMFFGRPYWNLGAVKKCLSVLPGFDEAKFHSDLQIPGGSYKTPFTLRGLLKAIPVARAIEKIWKEQEAIARSFTFDENRPVDFKTLITEEYRRVETNYFRTIYCASLAKMDFLDSFPDADYTKLVAGLPPMKHLEPVRAIREGATVEELMTRFRHHSRRELDLRCPRWDEDREFVEQLVKSHGTTGAKPAPAEYRVPFWKRRTFHRKLARMRTFVWLREEMRDFSSRMYWKIRRAVLPLGDDAFFMTWQEILANDRSQIERRREIYEGYRNFKAPNEIGIASGGRTSIGASPGRATGIARVARSVEEAMRVEKGAILVCPFTDPGWTPVLDRVAGVVTETGGLLSHAAVICREYGIPAVLGVADATSTIRDGEIITVDGRGFIERSPK